MGKRKQYEMPTALKEAQEPISSSAIGSSRRVLMAQELERRITALENFQEDESRNQQ